MKKLVFIFVIGLFLFYGGSCYSQKKPNIIFILADDLGYGELESYGAKDVKTPNIDELAKNGILFSNAYANSTVCSPSRAALLTGNYPDMVGVPGVVRDTPENNWGNLKNDITTLPESLKKLNYNTALIGKWHLGYSSPDLPNDRGFDYFKGFVGDMMDDYNTHLRNGINWMRENNTIINPKGHATDLFTDWSIEYLTQNSKKGNPYFLLLAYNAPHDPIQPPSDWVDKVSLREKNASLKRKKMIAFVEHLDHNVGKIISHLKKTGEFENTLIVFTSDNGGALEYGANNQPLSGGKGDMLEGGIKVPCIVNLNYQSASKISHERFMLMDFYPTILQLAGNQESSELPSKTINTLLNQEDTSKNRVMIWMRREGHVFGGRIYYCISDGTYKLLQNNPFSPYQLYNVINDPEEKNPLEQKKEYDYLNKILTEHIRNTGDITWK